MWVEFCHSDAQHQNWTFYETVNLYKMIIFSMEWKKTWPDPIIINMCIIQIKIKQREFADKQDHILGTPVIWPVFR